LQSVAAHVSSDVMKNKLVVSFLFSLHISCAAIAGNIVQLQSYNELVAALKKGHRVTAIYDASNCKNLTYKSPDNSTLPPDSPDRNCVVGMDFTSHFFILYRDQGDPRYYVTVIADDAITGAPAGSFRRLKSLKVFDDDTAYFYASMSDFKTGAVMYGGSFVCSLSRSFGDGGGVSLFDHSAN